MKDTMTAWKFFLDFDKEQAYLNEMNRQGWRLTGMRFGARFRFERSQPGEYRTTVHITDRKETTRISRFAQECGYDIVPHPLDGLQDILYLSCRSDADCAEFASDAATRMRHMTRLVGKLRMFSVLYLILALAITCETVWCVSIAARYPEAVFVILTAIICLTLAVWLATTIHMFCLFRVSKRKLRKMETESEVYE